MSNKKSVRNSAIDMVKLIAMFMVLGLHLNVGQLHSSFLLSAQSAISCIAIPLFFMVSGFLLCKKELNFSYSKRKIKGILKFVFYTCTILIVFFIIKDIILHHSIQSKYFYLPTYILWFFQKGFFAQFWYFGAMIIIYLIAPFLRKIIDSRYLDKTIIICTIISFTFFILDLRTNFEQEYIPQTFRIYYWIMYFLIGAYVRIHQKKLLVIKYHFAIIAGIIYTAFQLLIQTKVRMGNEFFFGSLFCMVYAVCVFSSCLNIKTSNKFITKSSALFLPVYTLHLLLYKNLCNRYIHIKIEPNIDFVLTYIIYASITVSFCWLIMKNKMMKDLFRI